uniref:Uncharacterized protein n=1 Tax=Oncorhynchus tshawytscha TaxID=74940 RepID=A0A8C8H9D2_ONCTS
ELKRRVRARRPTNLTQLHQLCQEEWAKIHPTYFYSLMCLSGTILNLLVVYLVKTFKKLRTASNAFIVNVEISSGSPFPAGYQAFKDAVLFLGITSIFSHSLIAVNRYVLITKSPEGCSYLSPILSDPFEAGTLVLTIIGQTMVVLNCYFKIFRRVQMSVKRVNILHFPIVNNLPYSLPRKDKRWGFYVLAVCFIIILTTEPHFRVLLTARFFFYHGSIGTWDMFDGLFSALSLLQTNFSTRGRTRSLENISDPCSRENFGEGLQLELSPLP